MGVPARSPIRTRYWGLAQAPSRVRPAWQAALTGRTPPMDSTSTRCGGANVRVRVSAALRDFADWGALGTIIGERIRDYWNVPVLELGTNTTAPTSDELKRYRGLTRCVRADDTRKA